MQTGQLHLRVNGIDVNDTETDRSTFPWPSAGGWYCCAWSSSRTSSFHRSGQAIWTMPETFMIIGDGSMCHLEVLPGRSERIGLL
jgi:hypothetical protein